MKKLHELMMKKKEEGKVISPIHAHAKSGVLHNLMGELDKMGADKLGDHMKKVTVASDSKAGLEHGLKKASEMVEKGPLKAMGHDGIEDSGHEEDMSDEDGLEESPEHEASESPEMEKMEHGEGEESPEEIQAKIEELKEKLASLKSDKKSNFGI